jgi:hypothetical protein
VMGLGQVSIGQFAFVYDWDVVRLQDSPPSRSVFFVVVLDSSAGLCYGMALGGVLETLERRVMSAQAQCFGCRGRNCWIDAEGEGSSGRIMKCLR